MRRLKARQDPTKNGSGESTSRGILLDVKDRVLGVHSSLVLRGLTDQTLLVGEGHERRRCVTTLLVGN